MAALRGLAASAVAALVASQVSPPQVSEAAANPVVGERMQRRTPRFPPAVSLQSHLRRSVLQLRHRGIKGKRSCSAHETGLSLTVCPGCPLQSLPWVAQDSRNNVKPGDPTYTYYFGVCRNVGESR